MSEKKKETCTCGQCFEGWLSPKMRECLEYSAEVRYELAKSLLDTQDGVGEDITSVLPIDYARIDTSVHYLPAAVRDKIGPSGPSESGSSSAPSGTAAGDGVYRGFIAVFKVIRDLVASEEDGDGDADADSKGFPTVAAISTKVSELRDSKDGASKHVAAFLDNGGKVAHALDCVVDRAREELTPLGREYDSEKRYIDAMFASEHQECTNDQDFALVRARLGLPADTLGVFPEDEEDLRDPSSDDEE